ncbi:MAG: agmatine deiminase family protein [Hyphomicrobiales bacterium]
MAILTGNTAQSGDGRSVQSGFRMPDEAHPHTRTFMQWPVSGKVYDRVTLEQVQATTAEVANTISRFEPVVMLMDEAHAQSAHKMLSGKVDIWDIPTDDLWCRDSGPVFVLNEASELAIAHLNFNGWGNKQVHGMMEKLPAEWQSAWAFPCLIVALWVKVAALMQMALAR